MRKILVLLLLTVSLSSCFECIEEVSLKKDGTGSFVYILNLSQSKAEINTAFKLDSFMGIKIPSLTEVKSKIAKAKNIFGTASGISNLTVKEDYTEYIVEVRGNFSSIEKFNDAVKSCAKQLGANATAIEEDFNYTATDSTYTRSVAALDAGTAGKLFTFLGGKANTAAYTCIVKTEGKVLEVNNSKAKISPSGKNVLLKLTADEVIKNSSLVNFSLKFKM